MHRHHPLMVTLAGLTSRALAHILIRVYRHLLHPQGKHSPLGGRAGIFLWSQLIHLSQNGSK